MKSILKIIALFALTIFIFSCKKSSSNSSSYYFKGNYNGSAKTFNTSVLASKSNLGNGTYSLTIVGATSSEESGLVLWSDQDNFTAGTTYPISALDGQTNNSLSYVSPLGSSAASSLWNTTYDYGNVSESFSCTITEATSTYVKGTFSGVLYMATDSAVVSKTVDGGEFYAKFY
jgi:hypothetical protein